MRETEKWDGGGRYRDTRKKQLASVDSEDSRSDKKPDDHFGATRTTLCAAVFSVHCTSKLTCVTQCSGDHCIDSAHESPLVAPGKLACSLCSLLILLRTGISRFVLVSADGGVSIRQGAPIHEGVCGQMVH